MCDDMWDHNFDAVELIVKMNTAIQQGIETIIFIKINKKLIYFLLINII